MIKMSKPILASRSRKTSRVSSRTTRSRKKKTFKMVNGIPGTLRASAQTGLPEVAGGPDDPENITQIVKHPSWFRSGAEFLRSYLGESYQFPRRVNCSQRHKKKNSNKSYGAPIVLSVQELFLETIKMRIHRLSE